jgi:protein-S-isoprenylcysteine O-methyltransferase Ste14
VQKTIAVLGSALFFAVAPSVLAGLIPWLITHWEFRPPFLDLQATRAVGMLLIATGLPGLIDSFGRFALQGLGTPAPIAPPQNLVVTGLYRYVRNPIYVAVVAVILGQGILFGDSRLLIYGGLMWLAFHAFVLATRSRSCLTALALSTRISVQTSRGGFHGSRPGEPSNQFGARWGRASESGPSRHRHTSVCPCPEEKQKSHAEPKKLSNVKHGVRTLGFPFPKYSCEKCGGKQDQNTRKNNSLREPY